MATIHWTKELRGLVTARSREDLGPAPSLGRAWAHIRRGWRPGPNGFNAFAHRFEIARKHSPDDLVEIAERARAFVTSETIPEAAPDAEAAGYALAMYWMHPGASMLFDVVASYGAPLAQDAVLFAHGLKITNQASNYSIQYFVREPREGPIWATELRRAILRAEGEDRARCVAVAKERFPSADFHLKVTLAVAHPSQPEWAAELGREILANRVSANHSAPRYPLVSHVFMSLRDLDLVAPLLARRGWSLSFVDLVETFGDAVLPLFLQMLDSPHDRHELKHTAAALGAFESEEVARAMTKHLGKKDVREVAIPWFLRFPALAVPALEDAAIGRTKSARLAGQVLEQVRRAAQVSEAGLAEEATAEELPWILTSPPWAKPRRKRKAPEPLELELLPRPESITLSLEDRKHLASLVNEATPPMNEAEADVWQRTLDSGVVVGPWIHFGKLVPIDRAIVAFNEGRTNVSSSPDVDPWVAIARGGVAALPGFLRYLEGRFGKSGRRSWMSSLLGIDSARVAAALVPHIRGPHADLVRAWMNAHVDPAIVALVRASVGAGPHGAIAATELRALAPEHGDRIRAVAREWGENVLAAIEAILESDPRLDCPRKPPAMPAAWRPESLHRPRLANGKALPLWALDPIGHMLKFTELATPYAGLRDVALACDPRSLAEFSWSLAEGWELGGARQKDRWMLDSLAHFADEEVTRRTTPALKDPRILVVLGAIGTDAAAMELATIACRAGSRHRADEAESQLEKIARRRGMTKDELEDRITPTAGLDPDGGTTLDYGTRTLRVGFDARLEPYVVWESGERMRQLPPRRKSDDEAMVTAAQAKWRDLKEDMATIADRRARAVERAMTAGRAWSKAELLEHWVRHPLLVHMAQGIVWGIQERGELVKTFRIAEDHTFAGKDDAAVDAPEGARIVVPHRIEIDDAERWIQVFEDYRIVQPIDQLARAVHRLAEGEATASKIERPLPVAMTYYQLDQALARVGFADRSWGGNLRIAKMPLERSRSIAVVEYPYNVTQISSASVRFMRKTGEPITPGDVHPVEISEVARAIASVSL